MISTLQYSSRNLRKKVWSVTSEMLLSLELVSTRACLQYCLKRACKLTFWSCISISFNLARIIPALNSKLLMSVQLLNYFFLFQWPKTTRKWNFVRFFGRRWIRLFTLELLLREGGHACYVGMYRRNGTNEFESRPIGSLSLQRTATNDAIFATRYTKLSTRYVYIAFLSIYL